MIELDDLLRRIAALEKRVSGTIRHGRVEEVNTVEGWVRLNFGDGEDGPFLSPKIPYAQVAGGLKVHAPPTVGQQMTYVAPGGDPRQASAIPLTWSDRNRAPSDKGDENVVTFGDFRAELRGKELVIKVPRLFIECEGTTFELTGAGLKAVAADYQWD